MKREDVDMLVEMLEDAGLDNASTLVEETLLPMAIKKKKSLREAMDIFANSKADMDSPAYQLCIALTQVSIIELSKIDIDDIVTKMPPK